jgi:hypothetical protein
LTTTTKEAVAITDDQEALEISSKEGDNNSKVNSGFNPILNSSNKAFLPNKAEDNIPLEEAESCVETFSKTPANNPNVHSCINGILRMTYKSLIEFQQDLEFSMLLTFQKPKLL